MAKQPVKVFKLPVSRKKQLSELEITMFEEFADGLWTNRKHLTHPKTKLTDREMETIVHNVAYLMNEYIKDVFKKLFK